MSIRSYKGDYYRWESEECQERMLRRAHRWVGRVGNGLGRLLDLLGSLLGEDAIVPFLWCREVTYATRVHEVDVVCSDDI